MADQGLIAREYQLFYAVEPLGYTGADVLYPADQNGVISGTVQINGVNKEGVEVLLLWRPSMVAVKRTYTDVNGDYSFTGIKPSTTEYVVYIKDYPGGTAFNDIVYALIDTTP